MILSVNVNEQSPLSSQLLPGDSGSNPGAAEIFQLYFKYSGRIQAWILKLREIYWEYGKSWKRQGDVEEKEEAGEGQRYRVWSIEKQRYNARFSSVTWYKTDQFVYFANSLGKLFHQRSQRPSRKRTENTNFHEFLVLIWSPFGKAVNRIRLRLKIKHLK